MLTELKRWFGKPDRSNPAFEERWLALEREAQSLRLELAEREKILAHLEATLERQRVGEERRVTEAVQTQFERVIADAATPLTQLLTQAHLLEVAAKPLQARDVLAVAKRLIHVLEQGGLKIEFGVGENVRFDPNRHEPLGADLTLKPDQPVVVRFVGVSFRGKMLRKAKVENTDR